MPKLPRRDARSAGAGCVGAVVGEDGAPEEQGGGIPSAMFVFEIFRKLPQSPGTAKNPPDGVFGNWCFLPGAKRRKKVSGSNPYIPGEFQDFGK